MQISVLNFKCQKTPLYFYSGVFYFGRLIAKIAQIFRKTIAVRQFLRNFAAVLIYSKLFYEII